MKKKQSQDLEHLDTRGEYPGAAEGSEEAFEVLGPTVTERVNLDLSRADYTFLRDALRTLASMARLCGGSRAQLERMLKTVESAGERQDSGARTERGSLS
jgi:hypothetical protein